MGNRVGKEASGTAVRAKERGLTAGGLAGPDCQMTTPAGFIPSPLDHATLAQGQQAQPARGMPPGAAASQAAAPGLSQAVTAAWAQPGLAAPAGQPNSPAAPAGVPAPASAAIRTAQNGAAQAANRAPQNANGIAPTTPGRGNGLSAPFKLVAPNADMKDIPATIVGQSQANKGGAARGKPPASTASKAKDGSDRSRSAEASASTATGTGTNPTGAGTSQPVIQFRPNNSPATNGHAAPAPMPQPLMLPNGQVLAQIAPLTPEQLAELAQNTQLKNQLYAQLLYRSMAQQAGAGGQPPMQLQHLLNLSPPLLIPQAAPQQGGSGPPPPTAVPAGDFVQNLLMLPLAQAPAAAQAASAAPAQNGGATASAQNAAAPAKAGAAASPVTGAAPDGASPSGAAQPQEQQKAAATEGSAQAGAAPAGDGDKDMPDAVPSSAANAPSPQGERLAIAPKASGNLASSSSGNVAAAADARTEVASDATPLSRSAQDARSQPPPLIIRNWGSVGGGFVPFGAGQQKLAPKGGKVLPQGSVKAKPSAAIGAALGPNLVLPNGNVSGPRACAPVEAFELPGSVAKNIPAPSTVSGGGPSNSDPVPASATPPPPNSALADPKGRQTQITLPSARAPRGRLRATHPSQTPGTPRPEDPASAGIAGVPKAQAPVVGAAVHLAAPKPKSAKSRAQLEGEERKRGPAGRTSMYKGVTKHRRSGRWEAHVWVREDGKQAYLGGYSTEEEAAEAHDVAALKCHGLKAKTNFHISRYTALLDRLDSVPMAELVMAIRRTSPGFTRGSSSFRGVTQHKSGRWEVRIGLRGSKHVYLGLHTSEVEAARVYDRALVLLTGQTAATNFPVSNYKNQMEAYEQRISKGEELPGFQEDGEYSERAFEAWLREQAILPAQEEPTPSKQAVHPKSPEASTPAENGEAAAAPVAKAPVPRRTAPERKRKPPAALLDNDSEGSSPPALALNGSPRPGAKRKRSVLMPKRGRPSKDSTLNLSAVGKPKAGRPGRRKASEPSDNDTAAILMNLAAVAGEASGRPGSAHSPGYRSRSLKRQREEEDVEISDDEDEAMAWSPGRKHKAVEDAEDDPDLAHHVFVPPSALALGEPAAADETRPALSILRNLGATAAEIAPEPDQEPGAAQLGQWDLFVAWLGLCSVVGYMGHTMAILALQYETAE